MNIHVLPTERVSWFILNVVREQGTASYRTPKQNAPKPISYGTEVYLRRHRIRAYIVVLEALSRAASVAMV